MRFRPIVVLVGCGLVIASSLFAGSRVQRFGSPITEKDAVDFAHLAQSPAEFEGKTVRLQGVVQAVCQTTGCWMQVSSPSGKAFQVKSLDGTVRLPKTCAGQKVIVQGVVTNAAKGSHKHQGKGQHACAQAQWVVSMLGVELVSSGR
jgi:hypothetical protein